MVLLLASYENVFLKSRYIREMVCAKVENASQFSRFRSWNDYRCDYRFYKDHEERDGKPVGTTYGKSLIIDNESNQEIRTVFLIGYLDVENMEYPVSRYGIHCFNTKKY